MNHRKIGRPRSQTWILAFFFCLKITSGGGMKYVSIHKQPICHQKCCGRRAYCYTDFSMVPDGRPSSGRECIGLFAEVRVEDHRKGPRNRTQSRGTEMESTPTLMSIPNECCITKTI